MKKWNWRGFCEKLSHVRYVTPESLSCLVILKNKQGKCRILCGLQELHFLRRLPLCHGIKVQAIWWRLDSAVHEENARSFIISKLQSESEIFSQGIFSHVSLDVNIILLHLVLIRFPIFFCSLALKTPWDHSNHEHVNFFVHFLVTVEWVLFILQRVLTFLLRGDYNILHQSN